MSPYVTILLAVISSTGLWRIIQIFVERRAREEDAAVRKADTDANNRKILAAAQIAAQQAALESADRRYAQLESDHNQTRVRMGDLRASTEELIDIMEQLLMSSGVPAKNSSVIITLTWSVYRDARQAIKRARYHLW